MSTKLLNFFYPWPCHTCVTYQCYLPTPPGCERHLWVVPLSKESFVRHGMMDFFLIRLFSLFGSIHLLHLKSKHVQRSAKRFGCLLSYSQAEPGRELTQPSPRLLAEPCIPSMSRQCQIVTPPGLRFLQMPVSMVFPRNSSLRHIFNHYIFKVTIS